MSSASWNVWTRASVTSTVVTMTDVIAMPIVITAGIILIVATVDVTNMVATMVVVMRTVHIAMAMVTDPVPTGAGISVNVIPRAITAGTTKVAVTPGSNSATTTTAIPCQL